MKTAQFQILHAIATFLVLLESGQIFNLWNPITSIFMDYKLAITRHFILILTVSTTAWPSIGLRRRFFFKCAMPSDWPRRYFFIFESKALANQKALCIPKKTSRKSNCRQHGNFLILGVFHSLIWAEKILNSFNIRY